MTDTLTNGVGVDLDMIGKALVRELRAATAGPSAEDIRTLLNSVGIGRSRSGLAMALGAYEAAQVQLRIAQANERNAREAHDEAATEAEWSAPSELKTDGNKTYRWAPCPECNGTHKVLEPSMEDDDDPPITAHCTRCGVAGKVQVYMLADERKAWRAREVAKAPALVPLKAALREAEESTLAARDAIGLAEKRLQAARHDLDACVVELRVAALALPTRAAS